MSDPDWLQRARAEGRVSEGPRAALPHPAPPPDCSEAAFTAAVIDLARAHGWLCAHFRPARAGRGWRTPVQGDGAGFPDLVCSRERLVFAELKTAAGKLRPDQEGWVCSLRAAGQEVYIWRPTNWTLIEEVLR